jgi:hypothetical protein
MRVIILTSTMEILLWLSRVTSVYLGFVFFGLILFINATLDTRV